MSEPTSHEKREEIRAAREAEQRAKEAEQAARDARKSMITIALVILLFIAVGGALMYALANKPAMFVDREVHWHALFDITICGEKRELPCENHGSGTVHGKEFCGETLMHHHFDQTLHIEGVIPKKEDIALGRFFDKIGVSFDRDKIMDVKNGDLCSGKPGVLKMYVNDIPSTAFRDYIPAATPDGRNQIVKLVFEPEAGLAGDNESSTTLK